MDDLLSPDKPDSNSTLDMLFEFPVVRGAIKQIRKMRALPSRNDPRERMARQLLMGGYATVDQIMEASYGEWPLRGLDIERQNPQIVRFLKHESLAMKKGARLADKFNTSACYLKDRLIISGRASMNNEREIYINRAMLALDQGIYGKSNLNAVLGHEGAHILQGDYSWRAKKLFDEESIAAVKPGQFVDTADTIGKWLTNNAHTRSDYKPTPKKEYLRHGMEIQARMHELLMHGYQRWGRMPLTKDELHVALCDCGLDAPESMHKDWKNSPAIAEAKKTFSTRNPASYPSDDADDINAVQATLTDEGRKAFWWHGLPMLYGNLIEMYGDGPGRERMGPEYGPNTLRVLKPHNKEVYSEQALKAVSAASDHTQSRKDRHHGGSFLKNFRP